VLPDYETRLRQVLASGTGLPDVAMIESGFYALEANNPAFMALDEAPFNIMPYRDLYFPFWFDAGRGLDGVQRIVPNSPGMGAMFYRRDIALELFGSDDPETVAANLSDWDMVYQAGQQLRDQSGGTKFIVGDAFDVFDIMRAQTGKPYVVDGVMNFDHLVAPFEMARQFRASELDGKISLWSPEWAAAKENGIVFMYNSGSWYEAYGIISALGMDHDQDGLWGFTSMPVVNANIGGNGFAIPVDAEQKELAWEFILFATQDFDMQADQLKLFACYPALIGATEDPYFDLPVPLFGGQARSKFTELGMNMAFIPPDMYNSPIATIFGKYTEAIFNGEMEIQEAFDLVMEEARTQFTELN
jgi:multiple sugar transport system substrate-binding protein